MKRLPMRLRASSLTPMLAGVLLAGTLGTLPAGAQWIGAPGGSTGGASSGAVTVTPVPEPEAELPAAEPAPGFDPGFSSSVGPASPGSAAPGFSPGAGAAIEAPRQANPNAAECQEQVAKLRGEVETRGGALQGAAKKKLSPSELCPMFRSFASAQQNFYSFLSTNKAKCGVPDEVLTKFKENVSSVNTTRNRICQVAKMQESGGGAGPGGPPPQGSVSAGLGLSSGLPTMETPPGGVFDTLGGDALR
ncbi:hypothetical protein [Ancylobacter dichloromethanicus]|uniref:hypothetical protein n=1 Tax=Ancylobacter dichloromethanicus TaxID=518825 RepID=UPI001FE67175|nr:hypothetical protein [Ancylobacter dichloromethanicus]